VFERMDKNVHPFVGMDLAPLFLALADDSGFLHGLLISTGATVGNPHLRTGVYGSIGILGMGAGTRTVWTPFETRSGLIHGFEARMGAYVGTAGIWSAPIGEAMLLYVTSLPTGGEQAFDRRLPGVIPSRTTERTDAFGVCRRFGFSLGAVGGGSGTSLSWDFVGSRIPFTVSATPAAIASCESGYDDMTLLLSLESAPWYRYRIPWGGDAGDTRVRHMGSMTAGYMLGNDTIRVGPTVTAGIWALGGGGRILFTPIHTKAAGHHGIEARGMVLWPSVSSWEGGLYYTVWMDPRR